MIDPVSRSLLLATMILLAGFSGCTDGEPPVDAENYPIPATLEPPKLSPGDSWNYVNDQGQWQNYTVEAIEEFEGRTTYRMLSKNSEISRLGYSQSTSWIDTETLGPVAVRGEDGYQCKFEPSTGIFPMINRTYTHSIDCPGYQTTGKIQYRVYGWSAISTPAGMFQAIELRTYDENTNQTSVGWFAPQVGNNVVEGEGDEMYRLAAWRHDASSEGG